MLRLALKLPKRQEKWTKGESLFDFLGYKLFISSSASTRFQAVDRQLETLRREMRSLSARLHELESNSSSASPSKLAATLPTGSLHRILDAPKSPTYVGPTSAEFGLGQPQKSPSQPEIDGTEDGPEETLGLSTGAASPVAPERRVDASAGDPLESLGTDEALRLVQVYEDTVGVMYPCVDLDGVRAYRMYPQRQDSILLNLKFDSDLQDYSTGILPPRIDLSHSTEWPRERRPGSGLVLGTRRPGFQDLIGHCALGRVARSQRARCSTS